MTQIERVTFVDGGKKIIEAPFKFLGDTVMTVGSLLTGNTDGFKNGLSGMVNDVIDVPSGVLDVGSDVLTAPKTMLGGQSNDKSSGIQKITMGTGNAMDIPIGVVQIGQDALDAIRPGRRGFNETYGNVPTPQARPKQNTQNTQKTQKTTTVTTTTTTTQVKDDETQKSDGIIHVQSPIKDKPDKIQIELRDNIAEAQQTNETLNGTINEAKQTDEALKGTIDEAKKSDTALKDSIDQANKANDDLKNNLKIMLDNQAKANQPIEKNNNKDYDKKHPWWPYIVIPVGLLTAGALAFLFRGRIKNLFKHKKLQKGLASVAKKSQKTPPPSVINVKPSPVSPGTVIKGQPQAFTGKVISGKPQTISVGTVIPGNTSAVSKGSVITGKPQAISVGTVIKGNPQAFSAGQTIAGTPSPISTEQILPTDTIVKKVAKQPKYTLTGNKFDGALNVKADSEASTLLKVADSKIDTGLVLNANSNLAGNAAQSSELVKLQQKREELDRAAKLNRLATEAETNKGQKASNDIKNWMQGKAEQAKVQASKADAKRAADAKARLAEIEAKEKEAMLEKYKARIARKNAANEAKKANKEARKAANAQKVAAKEAADKEYSAAYQRNKVLTQAPDKENQATFNALREDIIARSKTSAVASQPSELASLQQKREELDRAAKLNRLATEAETNKGQKASNDIKNWMQGKAEQAKVQAQKIEAQKAADAQKKLAEIEAKEQEAMLEKYKARIARKNAANEAKKASKEARKAANAQKVAQKEAEEKAYSEALKRNKALTQAPDKENQATFDALREDIIARNQAAQTSSNQKRTFYEALSSEDKKAIDKLQSQLHNAEFQASQVPLSESGRNLFPAWNDEQMALLDEAGEALRAKEAAEAAKTAKEATSVVSNKRVLTTVNTGRKVNLEQLQKGEVTRVKVRLNPNGVPKKELASLQSSFRSLMGGKANALPKNAAVIELDITPSNLGQIRKLYKHLQITAA